MEFYVDSADMDAVKAIGAVYPIDGFTTNPNILTQAKEPLPAVFAGYRAYVAETGLKLFVQVTAADAGGMIRQAGRLRDYFGENLVVKLPATEAGYQALKALKAQGLTLCVTVIHSVTQALMAARAGASASRAAQASASARGFRAVRAAPASSKKCRL